MLPKKSCAPPKQVSTDYSDPPPVPWRTEKKLSEALLNLMESDEHYRRANWPIPDDKPVAGTKSQGHKKMARELFTTFPQWRPYVGPENTRGEAKLGRSLGLRLRDMKNDFQLVMDEHNFTGGGKKSDEQLATDPQYATKWEKIKETCPQFSQLRRLLGERVNVGVDSINNSGEDFDTAGILGSKDTNEKEADHNSHLKEDAEGEEDDVSAGDSPEDIAHDSPPPKTAMGAPENDAMEKDPQTPSIHIAKPSPPRPPRASARALYASDSQAPPPTSRKKRPSHALEGISELIDGFEAQKKYRFDEKQKIKRNALQLNHQLEMKKLEVQERADERRVRERAEERAHELELKKIENSFLSP
ncbi:MAG: hypothetical protein LQ343_007035 [Gyalolechia ehrenbergii]|nr:MAG: hypothetical protein LQ343_007035 [Gyalolechia ehrenbergii]